MADLPAGRSAWDPFARQPRDWGRSGL